MCFTLYSHIQVKENCNKCQYCMRKDVLKQACVYRKCVYLRKPVPRFRQEPATAGVASHKSAPTPPNKPTSTPVPPAPTNSANSASNSSSNITNNGTNNGSSSVTPVPNSSMPQVSAADIAPSSGSELSSCKMNQPTFATLSSMQGINNGVLDPLRHRMMEHPHRSLFDPMNFHSTLDPSRSTGDPSKPVLADARFPSGPSAPGLNTHCKLDQGASVINYASDINPAAVAVASPLNSVNSALGTHQSYQPNKGSTLPSREPYFPSMDTWSSVPYALPHASTWAAPALPNHHAAAAAAAAYGFQQHPTHFPPSFAPSCRLGLPDSAATQFASPAGPQPSFHHSMTGMSSFSQEFTHAASSHATMRGPVNPPFYHTPPHIPPSSISSFHGLGQFPTGQTSFGPAAYSMHPHTHMYPSGFYSFRTATEPQIYHLEVYPSQNPFKHTLREVSLLFPWEKGMESKAANLHYGASKDIDHDLSERLHKDLASPWEAYRKTTCEGGEISTEQSQVQVSCIPYTNTGSVKDRHTCSHDVADTMTSTVEIHRDSILSAARSNKKEAKLPKDVNSCVCDCNENILYYKLPKGSFVCNGRRLLISSTRKDVHSLTRMSIFHDMGTSVCRLNIVTKTTCLHLQWSKVISDNKTVVGVSSCSQTEQAIHSSAHCRSESLTLSSLTTASSSSFLFVVKQYSQMNVSAAFLLPTLLPCLPQLHSPVDGDRNRRFQTRSLQCCTGVCLSTSWPVLIIRLPQRHLVLQFSRTV